MDSAHSRAVALRAAREALVLLRNEAVGGAPLLPLRTSGLKLAFLGPHANASQDMLSNYHGQNTLVDAHTPLLAARARGLDVTHAKGCNICDVVPKGYPNQPCPDGEAKAAPRDSSTSCSFSSSLSSF